MRYSIVCLLLGSLLVRAEEPANDRFRPILVPVIAREELVAVRLDRQVYSRCANSFADLRVRDSEGARISHTVRPLTITHQVVSETAWTRVSPRSSHCPMVASKLILIWTRKIQPHLACA